MIQTTWILHAWHKQSTKCSFDLPCSLIFGVHVLLLGLACYGMAVYASTWGSLAS